MSKLSNVLSVMFQKLIDNPETRVRVWEGKVPVINPSTKQPTGDNRITANLDIEITPALAAKANEHLSLEDKGDSWVKINVFKRDMVLIDVREDKVSGRVIAQFAVPNLGNWTNVSNAAFASNFEDVFSKANKTVKAEGAAPKVDTIAKAALKAELESQTDDEFERLMKQ